MRLRPKQLAIEYYFGDLQCWKLPKIAAEALGEGYDGPALKALAWITEPVEADIDESLVDAAFREMGIAKAPISKDTARLLLAAQLADGVLNGSWNAFEAATRLRVHLCDLNEPPPELRKLWNLAEEARNAPKRQWPRYENDLRQAFSNFLADKPL